MSENTPIGDYTFPTGARYARFYTFTLSESSTVTVELKSSTDPYMYLMQGKGKTGAILHYNDDVTSDDRNSRISQSLSAGDYTIEATTYEIETTGTFTLTVSGLPATATPTITPTVGAGDTPTVVPTPTPTATPISGQVPPTVTPTPTPTQTSVPSNVLNRLTALETRAATQQELIATMESKITALDSRIAALESDVPSPTPTPTVTPTPTATATPSPSVGTDIGNLAPNFTLPSALNGNYTLEAFRGDKNVVLVFYRASWDPFCRSHLVELSDHYAAIEQQDAIILAVSSDNLQGALIAARDWEVQFPILYNPDRSVISEYDVLDGRVAKASTFIIDKKGVIRWKYVGSSKTDRPSPHTILQQLQALEG